jgi:hypothetical protein
MAERLDLAKDSLCPGYGDEINLRFEVNFTLNRVFLIFKAFYKVCTKVWLPLYQL